MQKIINHTNKAARININTKYTFTTHVDLQEKEEMDAAQKTYENISFD